MVSRPSTSEDAFSLRIPPHNLEAERCVLGCCILDEEAMLTILSVSKLSSDDFYHPGHRYIFDAIKSIAAKGMVPDYLSLTDALNSMGKLSDAGGPEYIAGLTNVVPSVRNAQSYAQIVREKAQLRFMMKMGSEIAERAALGKEDARTLMNWAARQVLFLMESRDSKTYTSVGTAAEEYVTRFTQTYDNAELPGIPSGFPDLDKKLLGFQPGNLIILAARPSQGKTALALDFARNVAREGKGVAFISLEMSRAELLVRLICAEGKLDAYRLRKKQMSRKKDVDGKTDWDRLNLAMAELLKMKENMFIDDSSSLTISELRAKVQVISLQHHLDMVIIDYLQLIDGELGSGDMRVQEVSKISRSLKALARELNVPVIALSQLSRHIERREGHRKVPQLSDLRESGSLEQDADVVLFIHREISEKEEKEGRQYDPDEVEDTQLIVAKNRNGEIGKIYLEFFRKFATFKSSTERPVTYTNL